MNVRGTVWIWTLGTALVIFAAAGARAQTQAPAQAPSQQHVVSLDDLSKDAAQRAETRQTDEASVRELLSSEAGQTALKSAKVDYQRVDKAIGQLSDEDLAKIAARSRQAESDFAAGGLKATLIIVTILIVVLIVVLSLVF
jgi:uncharacterized membrane protein YdfJ with MMPL/SSD domain